MTKEVMAKVNSNIQLWVITKLKMLEISLSSLEKNMVKKSLLDFMEKAWALLR